MLLGLSLGPESLELGAQTPNLGFSLRPGLGFASPRGCLPFLLLLGALARGNFAFERR